MTEAHAVVSLAIAFPPSTTIHTNFTPLFTLGLGILVSPLWFHPPAFHQYESRSRPVCGSMQAEGYQSAVIRRCCTGYGQAGAGGCVGDTVLYAGQQGWMANGKVSVNYYSTNYNGSLLYLLH